MAFLFSISEQRAFPANGSKAGICAMRYIGGNPIEETLFRLHGVSDTARLDTFRRNLKIATSAIPNSALTVEELVTFAKKETPNDTYVFLRPAVKTLNWEDQERVVVASTDPDTQQRLVFLLENEAQKVFKTAYKNLENERLERILFRLCYYFIPNSITIRGPFNNGKGFNAHVGAYDDNMAGFYYFSNYLFPDVMKKSGLLPRNVCYFGDLQCSFDTEQECENFVKTANEAISNDKVMDNDTNAYIYIFDAEAFAEFGEDEYYESDTDNEVQVVETKVKKQKVVENTV